MYRENVVLAEAGRRYVASDLMVHPGELASHMTRRRQVELGELRATP